VATTPAWSDGQRPDAVLSAAASPTMSAETDSKPPRVRIRSIRLVSVGSGLCRSFLWQQVNGPAGPRVGETAAGQDPVGGQVAARARVHVADEDDRKLGVRRAGKDLGCLRIAHERGERLEVRRDEAQRPAADLHVHRAQPRGSVKGPATVVTVSAAAYRPDCGFESFRSAVFSSARASTTTLSVSRTSLVGGRPAGSSASVPV
jgi:hypothetical protein